MITGAQAIVASLQEEHVKVIFGYPGATICPFYDALSSSDIKHVLVRHEQNAGHCASGYARISKKPGVCVATSGPGALNLITAIATAYMDSIPLIIITGQVSNDQLGLDVFQEADITGSAEPFVKHSYLVKAAKDIPRIFKEAFFIANTGRNGPVLIDIPIDVQKELIEFSYPETVEIRGYSQNQYDCYEQIKNVALSIASAKRPLICSGGGVISANATRELSILSKTFNIPIITTMMGISSISQVDSLNLGMIGMYGNTKANTAMNLCDLLILVGARVGDRAIMSPIGLSRKTTIIHIDVDPAEIDKKMHTDFPLIGDAKKILTSLINELQGISISDWISKIPDKEKHFKSAKRGYVNPRKVISSLCKQARNDSIIVADVGQNQIWTARGYSLLNGRFLTSGGMGTMGYSIPAAIGANLADKTKQIIAVCGDGAFQMQMMELATISQNKLPIKIIIMNNSTLGMIRELQDMQYQKNEFAVSLESNPDFNTLASAYKIESSILSADCEIESAINELLSCDEAFILNCIIDPNESTL